MLKHQLYKTIAGIYALGKVQFENLNMTDPVTDGCKVSAPTENAFDIAEYLLCLKEGNLLEVLTTRSIKPRGRSLGIIT